MPILDGFEACKKMMSYFESHHITNSCLIMALTGHLDDQVETECMSVGFDMAMQCPLTYDIIKSNLIPNIKRKQQSVQAMVSQEEQLFLKMKRSMSSISQNII